MAYEIPTDIWFMLDDAINNGYEDVLAADLVCDFGLPPRGFGSNPQRVWNPINLQLTGI